MKTNNKIKNKKENKKDDKLYNEYLNGNKKSFEELYKIYNKKINYFIYNIVKDYQIAEDITQEVFIYIMKNKIKENLSFKYHIYLVAKSKALNHINKANRRKEIEEIYLKSENKNIDNRKDILHLIIKEENKKEILEAIEMLEDKYKNAIYLTQIENLSYEETSKIINETMQNTKTIIHRGKQKLNKILIKKGFDNMNKSLKILIIIIGLGVILTGGVYASKIIYENYKTNHNIKMNPTYESTINENTVNNLWIGTLDLAWKELGNQIGKDKIEIANENLEIINNLNNSKFTKEMLNPNSYKIDIERTATNGYKIHTSLNKKLNFLESFDNFKGYKNHKFGNGEEPIKYFGINNASPEKMNNNIEVLFYNKDNNTNKSNDFAIKLKTKEDDEIILYRTDDKKTFDKYYEDINKKSTNYDGSKIFSKKDELLIPYINLSGMICYNELYNKLIKDTNGLYTYDVIQDVDFKLNEKGVSLNSNLTMVTEYLSYDQESKYFYFNDKFIIFIKEKEAKLPYFCLKVDNDDILEKIKDSEDSNLPDLIDYTMLPGSEKYNIINKEYKFYEDEKYEYYYPSQKTKLVVVLFKDTGFIPVEQALKEKRITIDLLDKYNVEYFKKEK